MCGQQLLDIDTSNFNNDVKSMTGIYYNFNNNVGARIKLLILQ